MAIPSDLQQSLRNLHDAISVTEEKLNAFYEKPYAEYCTDTPVLLKARLDIMVAFATNSCIWAKLCCQGENPQELPVYHEIQRVKSSMERLKDIMAKQKHPPPKLDKVAAKNFVRSAMFDLGALKRKDVDDQTEHEVKAKRVASDAAASTSANLLPV